MVISQPPGNNFPYYYRASPTLPQLLWMLQRHLMFYTCNYNIRVTHRNGAIKHILHESDPRRDHQQIVLYSFCHPYACSSSKRLKYYFKSFCMKIWARWPYIHLSVVFPSRMPAGPHFVTQPILLSENIPKILDINHQQNTRRSDQKTETIKTIMQTYAPRITWKVLPMAQVAIFKEIFDQVCEKI